MVSEIKWIAEGPNAKACVSSASAVVGVRPRRAHTKSRTGCNTCKTRRKKCDESQPACQQCQRKGIQCDYLSNHRDAARTRSMLQSQSQYSMSRQSARKEIAGVLELLCEQNGPSVKSHPRRVDVLQLIDHFLSEKNPWMGTPATQKTFQKHGMRLGMDAPHMLHAIVAFSAAHLDHLYPDPKLRVAAVHHYGRLVALYAVHMEQLGTETINHLFGTCILLTMLSYLVVGYDNPDLLCNPEEHECNWEAFRSLGGVRIMQGVPEYRAQLSQGVWRTMLEEAGRRKEEQDKAPVIPTTWWSNIMKDLCDLCDVSQDLQHGDPLYLEPLRGLNKIVHGGLDHAKIGQLMHFIGGLSPAFAEVLEQLELRAMLIVLYWHILLLLIGQWWTSRTGLVASRRAIAYLWKLGGTRIRKSLVFPAALCGLDVQYLDRLQKRNRGAITNVSPHLEIQLPYQ
ncbi:hypothetical protein K458DRAFT_181944 [Lentithecium fluviatile CBS 122367]|uniref:Zn(2)-C6 fungal-type domain-containing protein n=1 Tax=Lentithecium fluviatile CBS 122367 TaxID=1168545 RepID=A0A6G1IES4_9PLEO|nr:hypothetical protein K458DRAFT_181944 [Lentithecium fluviatile CBS 122367]